MKMTILSLLGMIRFSVIISVISMIETTHMTEQKMCFTYHLPLMPLSIMR